MSDASHRIDADDLLAQAAWLRALARNLVHDEHAADDVVQETFAAAIDRPPREPGALRGWLAKVARNAAWKSIRGERRRAAREIEAPRRAEEPSAAEVSARIETQRALLDAVQALDEPFRTVIVMRFYDGKTPREIAAALGVTPEVVWQRLSRATAMLRARLDRKYGKRETWAVLLMSPLGAKSAATWGTTATAVGTGVAIVGTKTVVAATAAVVLGAWLVWPRAETRSVVPPKETSTAAATPTPPVAKPAPTPRVRADTSAATSADVAPAVPHAKTRGRVVDAVSGEPLAGAKVKVVRKSPGGGFQWTLTTGADGTFSGEVAETARYSEKLDWSAVHAPLYVEASARGHLWFYEGPWSGPQGEDLGDVKLDPGVVVRGRVVRDDGRPVADAHVYATAGPAQAGTDDPINRARFLGVADGDGRFELDEALAPTTGGKLYTLLAACPDGVAFKTLAIRPGRDAIDDVVLTLHVAAAAVRVLDADGRPLEGATVSALPRFGAMGVNSAADPVLYSIAGDDVFRAVFVQKTGADGFAQFAGLPIEGKASLYDLAASAPGFTVGWARTRGIGNPRDAEIEIRLKREEAYVVGARVVDADGRPVEGALVTYLHGDSASVTTGADGVFVLRRGKGEPFGRDASVEITKDGFAKQSETVWRWPDDGRKMADIRLLRPAAITGRVVDQDGRAIAGAMVFLKRTDAWVKPRGDGKSDADGRFEFPDATEGDWALVVSPIGGTWVVPPWKAVRGGDADVVVRLERVPEGRATVVVTVLDAEAGVLVDVDGAMLLDAGPPSGRRVMGALPQPKIEHGRVTLERVAPGAHSLWLRIADRPHQLVRFQLADGETDVRATCRVRRGAVLTGRVRLPEGVTDKNVGIEYSLADGQLSAGGPGWGEITAAGWAKVAADGTFRIEGVTPAAYRLTANVSGWLGDVVVDATDGDAEGVIELTRGAVVKVTIPGGAAGIGGMLVETSLNGRAWTELARAGLVPDRPFSVTRTLPPGTLRWRATFRATPNFMDPIDAAEPQSGEVVLEVGKDVEIIAPVVARK